MCQESICSQYVITIILICYRYKNKKTTRLTQLIIDLKKKKLEEEEEERKELKRERYKKELADIVLGNIKEPVHDTK